MRLGGADGAQLQLQQQEEEEEEENRMMPRARKIGRVAGPEFGAGENNNESPFKVSLEDQEEDDEDGGANMEDSEVKVIGGM